MKPDATHRMVDENEVLDIYGWFPMKPLTKTVVSRDGGIAARFAVANPIVQKPKKRDNPPVPVEPTRPKQGSGGEAVAVNPKSRYARWREKNPDLYKERQAKYQADYRARKAQAANPD